MIQKFTIITLIFMFFSQYGFSQKVDYKTSKLVAKSFFPKKTESKSEPVLAKVKVENLDTLLYFYNFGDDGFVIISGDKKLTPVLAYSTEGSFVDDGDQFAFNDWMEFYGHEVKVARLDNKIPENNGWVSIPENEMNKGKAFGVAALLTTKWNQDDTYNYYCPQISNGPGGRCYAGCVATTMSQIMKFWNYPAKGEGSHSYYHPYFVNISANFDSANYDWSAMTNTINASSRNAIANLMYHCGVAVDMNYGPYGSGASSSSVPLAMKIYFDYHPSIEILTKTQFSVENWNAILWDNLDQGWPIYYSGHGSSGGHAFVLDGYSDSTYFHFNWGWGGANNGYFSLSNLNSGNGDFSLGQQAIINFVPYNVAYCKKNRVLSSPTKSFGDGSGYSKYWNDTDCDWLIQPADADQIVLNFTDFRTEPGVDILSIYDGVSTSGQLLGTFSGNNLPSTIIATSGSMFLTFSSNSTNQDFGWEASYETITLGLSDETPAANIIVYPNPASDEITIMLPSNTLGDVFVNVFDLSGKLIVAKQISLSESKFNLDIQNISDGYYYLSIENQDIKFYKGFLKK